MFNNHHTITRIGHLSLIALIGLFLFILDYAHAGRAVRNWQTTKTSSLGGAGIAAPTMIEGLYLNPAMFAYFANSSFYFQNKDGSIEPVSTSRSGQFGNTKHPEGFSAAITDGSNTAKGGFAYTDQEESGTERKKYSFGFGNSIDGNSAFGVSYSYAQDEFNEGSVTKENKLHIANLGYMYILDPKLSIALIWNDPAWSDRMNSKAVAGVHYRPLEKLAVLLDFGFDVKRSINKTFYYAVGAELEFYTDLYARFGVFQDKIFNIEGQGFGLGWIGPILGLEVSMKKTKKKDEFTTYLLNDEKLKETELSLIYLF